MTPAEILAQLRDPDFRGPLQHCRSWVDLDALMDACVEEIERLQTVATAARNVAETLNGGFVVCGTCGDQETTTDLDYAPELYAALGIKMAEKTPW
jgi:hypothetical protein